MELGTLLNAQHDLLGRISRSVENLKKMGMANITLSAVETRIKLLDQHWEKFERQHDMVLAAYGDKYSKSEYATADVFDMTENTYVQQRSTLLEYAGSFKPAPSKLSSSHEHTDYNHKTALPRIKLPQFSGAYEDWPSFRDLFQSVIGENSAISNIERFHYLRSCLLGPAERLIKPLALTGENYDRAWSILSRHFENKRELIRANFTAFTSVPKMKSDTAEELSRVYHAVTTAVNAQESIGRPIPTHGMDLFHHLVVELFDSRTRLEWESSTCDSTDPPSHDTLTNFISKRILTLNAARPGSAAKSPGDSSRSAKTHLAKHSSDTAQCSLCKGKHSLTQCSDFKEKTAEDRKSFVELNKLCYNCLGNHMIARCQSTKACFTCNSRHHTSLHEAFVTQVPAEASSLSVARKTDENKAVLLATARVTVADRYGNPQNVRVLIDQGSEVSLISESLARRLRLSRSRARVSIFGIGGSRSGATRGRVSVTIASKVTSTKFSVAAFILPRLSLYQGAAVKWKPDWPHVQRLPLADPQFASRDPIDLLLGAEVCSIILEDGLRKGGPQAPIAQKTALGWILSGGCNPNPPTSHLSTLQCTANSEQLDLVHRFRELDRKPHTVSIPTPEMEECEQLFVRNRTRTSAGRQVFHPLASPPKNLASTRQASERFLFAMERKVSEDPQVAELSRTFMRECENLGHLETVPQPSLAKDIADIERMYRQIIINLEDRHPQPSLWRPHTSKKVREFRFTTVTYGLAPSSVLSIRSLHQLAEKEQSRYPLGAKALRRDYLVDDIATGANSFYEAIALQTELRELCMAGGLPLRKRTLSSAGILASVSSEHRLQRPHAWKIESHAALGLQWHTADDCLALVMHPRQVSVCAKRQVRSETGRQSDPSDHSSSRPLRAPSDDPEDISIRDDPASLRDRFAGRNHCRHAVEVVRHAIHAFFVAAVRLFILLFIIHFISTCLCSPRRLLNHSPFIYLRYHLNSRTYALRIKSNAQPRRSVTHAIASAAMRPHRRRPPSLICETSSQHFVTS